MSEREAKLVHVWITKYALTSGIIEADAEICHDISEKMISVRATKDGQFDATYHKPHWHSTLVEANAQVKKMAEAKVASLKKQLTKIMEIYNGLS